MKTVAKQFDIKYLFYLAAFGALATFVSFAVTLMGIAVVFYALSGIDKKKEYRIWQVMAASPYIEILSKASKCPILPYEFGKYLMLMTISLLLYKWAQSHPKRSAFHVGKLVLAAMAPSCLYAFFTTHFNYPDWLANAFGILGLAIMLLFAAKERWQQQQLFDCLRFGLMFIIPILVFITIRTPAYEDVSFGLGANFQTSGGFGSNQVSTILGAAMFVNFVLIIMKEQLIKYDVLNYGLLGYCFFRGLLTFSRGGVIAAILAIFIFYTPVIFKNRISFIKSVLIFLVILVFGFGVFLVANKITGNNLLLRYKGETQGTLNGTKEQSLNNITSRRSDIVLMDWVIFQSNPIFGVGPGKATKLREEIGDKLVSAHVEFSRLLSEHGVGGGITFLILVIFPFVRVFSLKSKTAKSISASFMALAILTTFHAATRTNTTTVFYVLGAISIQYYTTRRKIVFRKPAVAPKPATAVTI